MYISIENRSQYIDVQFHLNIAKYSSTLNKQNIRNMLSLDFLSAIPRVVPLLSRQVAFCS